MDNSMIESTVVDENVEPSGSVILQRHLQLRAGGGGRGGPRRLHPPRRPVTWFPRDRPTPRRFHLR